MNIFEMLQELQNKALKNADLRAKILATESMEEPLGEFCKVCQQEEPCPCKGVRRGTHRSRSICTHICLCLS